MERRFGRAPAGEERPERRAQHMVENAAQGLRDQLLKGMGGRPATAADQQRLFQLSAELQCILTDQMAASQAQTNTQLWEQVTKFMAQVWTGAQRGEGR